MQTFPKRGGANSDSLGQSAGKSADNGAYLTKTRALVGVAAVAVAVTIPDLSAGAMNSPYLRIDMGQSVLGLPDTVWTPSARPTAPIYASVQAAEEIAPAALTYASRANFSDFDRELPLEVLELGSERFDLAFAGVTLPSVETVSLPQTFGRREIEPSAPAPLAQLVEVPQITMSRAFRVARAPSFSLGSRSLELTSSENGAVAVSNDAIEAAFAGVIDVSEGARRAVPLDRPAPSDAPSPIREPVARAVPIPAVDPALSASAAAQAQLSPKSQLDARVNGVLTGSVDFRQTDGTIAIRLRSVVDMLHNRFSASELNQITSGQSIDAFVTLEELQAAGIPINYNPAYDEVEFGVDYNDAPEAAKVQVEQIGAPTVGDDRVMIDQIRR